MQIVLEMARTGLALFFLLYASWSDYKTREVSNTVWLFFAPPAFALTFIELFFYADTSNLIFYALCFGLTSAFAVVLFYGGGFGGADAKALMCLALALPFYPQKLGMPFSWDMSPISEKFFPITVFSNAVLLAAATAVYMFFSNILWNKGAGKKLFEDGHKKESLGRKILVLVTGQKVSISKLKEKWHIYPLEDIEEHGGEYKRKLVVIPREEDRNTIVERLAKAVETGKIQDKVWATPGLPMLIFVTAGLVIALLFGDVIWIFVRFLLG